MDMMDQCDSCIMTKECPYYQSAENFIKYLLEYKKPDKVKVSVEVYITECYMDKILK